MSACLFVVVAVVVIFSLLFTAAKFFSSVNAIAKIERLFSIVQNYLIAATPRVDL